LNSLPTYHHFKRPQWALLRAAVPMTLCESDLVELQGINESLSMEEVTEVYLPLSRLLNLYVKSKQSRARVQSEFLAIEQKKTPYIIGISGSVAVGKSTTARILQALLERWSEHPTVALVTTDGFLHPNAELEIRGIMDRKGFPESYDTAALIKFVTDMKSGVPELEVPLYSHQAYDIQQHTQSISQPDILILEGLNVLQTAKDYPKDQHPIFVSDYLDFSLFVDADEVDLERWYVQRFLSLCASAFKNESAYFHHYASLGKNEAIEVAKGIWRRVNRKNLEQNVLPTRGRADLILKKASSHQTSDIYLQT